MTDSRNTSTNTSSDTSCRGPLAGAQAAQAAEPAEAPLAALPDEPDEAYLECERPWVYWLLILAAGWFGAYTVVLRGGVFCNAQTANVVMLAVALGKQNWARAAYLLIPITAYFAGAFFSEYLGKSVKKLRFLRWDTILIGIEIAVVLVLGALPVWAPDQIAQIALNFICSMQFNTFRQVQGIPAATTFVTNHIRQVGSTAAKLIRHKTPESAEKIKVHSIMILFFIIGGVIGTICCKLFKYRSIWGTAIVLGAIFIRLAYTDLSYERKLLGKVPHGH